MSRNRFRGSVGGEFRGVENRHTPRLNVVKRLDGCYTPQGLISKMAIFCYVDRQDKGRKVDENANSFGPNKTTSRL